MEIIKLDRKIGENNKDYVYRCLRESIVTNSILPGEIISEPKLQQLFGLSRSPIREAISILRHEELIEVVPQKGTRIVLINKEYVKESRFLRYVIEREVTEEICKYRDVEVLANRLDNILNNLEEKYSTCSCDNIYKLFLMSDSEFHSEIFMYNELKYMWKILRVDNIQYDRFLNLYLQNRLSGEKFIKRHRELIKLIRNRDIYNISNQLLSNYHSAERYLEELSLEHPEYFKE